MAQLSFISGQQLSTLTRLLTYVQDHLSTRTVQLVCISYPNNVIVCNGPRDRSCLRRCLRGHSYPNNVIVYNVPQDGSCLCGCLRSRFCCFHRFCCRCKMVDVLRHGGYVLDCLQSHVLDVLSHGLELLLVCVHIHC